MRVFVALRLMIFGTICVLAGDIKEPVSNLEALKAQLLARPLDLSGVRKGFSGSRPIISSLSGGERASGAVWKIMTEVEGPARLKAGAKMASGNPGDLKTRVKVTITAFRDGRAAEEGYLKRLQAQDPNNKLSAQSARAIARQCIRPGGLVTECIYIDQKLPIILENEIQDFFADDAELSRLEKEVRTPLMEGLFRQLAAAAPPGPSIFPKAKSGTVWSSFSALSPNAGKETAPNEPTTEGWQNSWDLFAREVQAIYSRNAGAEEISRRFNNKRVTWEGTLDTVEDLSQAGFRARLLMPPHMIQLPDGSECSLNQLDLIVPSVTMREEETPRRFRATLVGGNEPAISIATQPNGTKRVVVRLGAPVELEE